MKVDVRIDPDYPQPLAVIHTAALTEEVSAAVRMLSDTVSQGIAGYRESGAVILEPDEIVRIYADGQRVTAVTGRGTFQLRYRLYQLEDRLTGHRFARISNSELINLKEAAHFDLSMTGTIVVRMKNGDTTYVSRRYVKKIKEILGL